MLKKSWLALLALALIGALVPATLAQEETSKPDVVISQIFGGGGGSSAPFANDYVELFNRGATWVDITGWSLQYASGPGSSWSKVILSGGIGPGRYFLVQLGASGEGGAPLPMPDFIEPHNINISATNGKLGLLASTRTFFCGATANCLPDPDMIDFVGYGNAANNFLGKAPAPAVSNKTAIVRHAGGCAVTGAEGDNRADFAEGRPMPRNRLAVVTHCNGPSSVADLGVEKNVNTLADGKFLYELTVVNLGPAPATHVQVIDRLGCAVRYLSDDSEGAYNPFLGVWDVGDLDVGIFVNLRIEVEALQAGEHSMAYAIPGAEDDPALFGNKAEPKGPKEIAKPAKALSIHDIQGRSHISPLNNCKVSGVEGIVTARDTNGIYMQAVQPDDDPRTSEGMFVFTDSSAPPEATVGSIVSVSGVVAEYRPGADGLTITEIINPQITRLQEKATLPPPVIIGVDRVVPAPAIDDDSNLNAELHSIFDPLNDALDFYESLEGMYVQVNDAWVVGPMRDFGSNREIYVVPALVNPTSRGGVVIGPKDFNPARIILNDVVFRSLPKNTEFPPANVGDRFKGPNSGVMSYGFNNYRLQVVELAPLVSNNLQHEVTTLVGSENALTLVGYNVRNLAADAPAEEFEARARQIVNYLKSPDIISLEEIQDNSGLKNDGVVAADQTYSKLIEAIRSAGGPQYSVAQIDPEADKDGGALSGNIRVGFLYNPARVQLTSRPGGAATASTEVTCESKTPQLSFSPGRIDPQNPAFKDSRKPLIAEFVFKGQTLFVIGNHLNSKGGDQPLFGPVQPPILFSESQRTAQAKVLHDFIVEILACNDKTHIVVLGDLNDFEFSKPITTIAGENLYNLFDLLLKGERYSYVFQGNSQVLDQALVTLKLYEVAAVDAVHINAEFFDQVSDHDPVVMKFDFGAMK